MTTLEAALEFANRGWPVLPVYTALADGRCSCGRHNCTRAGKHPATRHGYKDATTNKDVITSWFSHGEFSLAIRTGQVSNLIILDCDTRDTLKKLGLGVPVTPFSETRRGRHYFFTYPSGFSITRCVLAENLEALGNRCYSIEPPSPGREWVIPPSEVEPAPPPVWLLEMLSKRRATPKDTEIANIALGVAEGERNIASAAIIGLLLGFLPRRHWETAWQLVRAWNRQNSPPLDERDLLNTFRCLARKENLKRIEKDATVLRLLEVAAEELSVSKLTQRARISRTTFYNIMKSLTHDNDNNVAYPSSFTLEMSQGRMNTQFLASGVSN